MNKAFIFDMDGVVVDSEHVWQPLEKPMLARVLGKEMAARMGSTIGLNVYNVYEKAKEFGSTVSFDDLARGYAELAPDVYARSEITPGVDALVQALLEMGFKIGLVTQSPQRDIDLVLPRLTCADKIERTLSVFDHPELRPKPSPDGYREIFRELNADPKRSFVLEDSNAGIESGKAAGAFVIGYRGNLLDGYPQTGADACADTMADVIKIVEAQGYTMS